MRCSTHNRSTRGIGLSESLRDRSLKTDKMQLNAKAEQLQSHDYCSRELTKVALLSNDYDIHFKWHPELLGLEDTHRERTSLSPTAGNYVKD